MTNRSVLVRPICPFLNPAHTQLINCNSKRHRKKTKSAKKEALDGPAAENWFPVSAHQGRRFLPHGRTVALCFKPYALYILTTFPFTQYALHLPTNFVACPIHSIWLMYARIFLFLFIWCNCMYTSFRNDTLELSIWTGRAGRG